MRNTSRLTLFRKIPNQTLRARYYPPKARRDIEELNPNYWNKSADEIREQYEEAYLNEHQNEFVEDKGFLFRYKDGTEDVYVKSGYEHEAFEYLDRQLGGKYKYRLITDSTHVDFVAGGRIFIGGRYFYLIKVIEMTSDIPTQNKYRSAPNMQHPFKYAPKVLALV